MESAEGDEPISRAGFPYLFFNLSRALANTKTGLCCAPYRGLHLFCSPRGGRGLGNSLAPWDLGQDYKFTILFDEHDEEEKTRANPESPNKK